MENRLYELSILTMSLSIDQNMNHGDWKNSQVKTMLRTREIISCIYATAEVTLSTRVAGHLLWFHQIITSISAFCTVLLYHGL